ncbi:MAG: glutathione S-transferase family protein [Proteobacteria bacterium]|nr:glutathione S-transferase family protein [Pseudomonadota bacterium]
MITLYHCLSARSFRPLWLLEEMQIPYELKLLPFPPRAAAKEYFEINVLGTVPFLIDGETRMSESAAICEYLAVKHGPTPLAVLPEEKDFGLWLNWLHQSDATLTFPQTLVLRYARFEPPERRQPQVAEDYAKWFLGRMRMLDAHLLNHEWLAAGRFTAADVTVGYALMLAEVLGLTKEFQPQTTAYWTRLKERDGFKRALAVQEKAAEAQGIPPIFPKAKAG